MTEESSAGKPARLGELASVFLKLGTTAFGGPAAHVAMMEEEIVVRRRWITREAFLDLLGATHMIPGPNSTEMAIHVGYVRAGWPGLLTSGSCFIVPAALIVGVLAWGYTRFGALPPAAAVLYGIKPVVIAVVTQALWRLGRSALKSPFLALLAAAAAILCTLGAHELAVLFGAGLAAWGAWQFRRRGGSPGASILTGLGLGAAAPGAAAPVAFGLLPMFLFFLKVGAVLFGSGYVLLAFLRNDLVIRWHWMTAGQLLDAVAVGQLTPGPVFTTATFIGYLLGGVRGAILATVGIFLPAFLFVAASGPLLPRLRRWPAAGAILDGINAASLSLMGVVTWQLGRSALVDWTTWLLAIACAVLLLRFRINSAWLVGAGALAGLARTLLFGAAG
jgi:chromate transporter